MRDARLIDPTDPNVEFRGRSLSDQGSASADPDRAGVGSTPYDDPTSSRVFVPVAPTPTGAARYLIRLAAVAVPNYALCRVRGLRQAVGIGTVLTSTAPSIFPVEIDQTSPFWSFVDGNISWHLRFIHGATLNMTPRAASRGIAGTSVDYANGTDSSLLLLPPSILGPTIPARGYPPGQPIGPLGTFRDLRFIWSAFGAASSFDFEVHGPGVLALYASIKQTNPLTRQQLGPLLPPGFPTTVLSREDQFVLALPNAIYRHVSGSIVCEMGDMNRRPGADPTQGVGPIA